MSSYHNEFVELNGTKNRFVFSLRGARLVRWDAYDRSTGCWVRLLASELNLVLNAEADSPVIKSPILCSLVTSSDALRRHDLTVGSCMSRVIDEMATYEAMEEERRRRRLEKPVQIAPVVKDTALEGNLEGFLYDVLFKADHHMSHSSRPAAASLVVFRATILQGILYPAPLEVTITYSLEPVERMGPYSEGLNIDIAVVNRGKTPTFVTPGIHPHFQNPFGKTIDDLELYCAVAKPIFVADEDVGVASGENALDIHTLSDAKRQGSIGKLAGRCIDGAYSVAKTGRVLALLRSKVFELSIMRGLNCDHLQVCTDPEGRSIGIHPQMGGPDPAADGPHGNIMVLPGDAAHFSTFMHVNFT
mmetsp:Transcript_30314/g.48989  ORF Transcript_30314/g.48989 Transcript_30314/m.48989 type:complete len:360 (-) Transcript_30314:964-2043(-)|eukprot:CAMPEP_0184333794 /NCGR_PEP_ID=MMETSP1089-20130417/2759_1 /TAXON_ID=38269 ORGANISM="Gloeochaete wittrockiana, Strain SAG46.84" /NCGR_SAMPLE_ID=MMETSP1089 /ASSEMBLY_ACC=CAM_ASM_000445 /LENGTH=359 /DNA_ID=CAMNT_0026657821 /DNA_START=206 /DNA_END=1285 /DNA_ORIENTATION=+